MPATFSRSMRALHGDRFNRTNRALLLAILFLGLWAAWFFLAHIALYETTDAARIEVERASYPLQSPISGKVVVTHLALGRQVSAGDLLVELDAAREQHQLDELRAHLTAVSHQIDALRSEMSSRRKGQLQNSGAGTMALQEARARYSEAETSARFAEEHAARIGTLSEGGGVAELDLQRVRSEAESRRAAADAMKSELARLDRQQRTDRTDRQVDIEHLNREIASLEGDAAKTRVSLERLEEEIDRHRIRAQVPGTIGEVAELSVGSVVHEGEKLGAVVPTGNLRVIASFPPASVFGRIKAGQRASMRLAGFPWTQYGSLSAVVTNVGSEVRDGQVRVELAIGSNRGSAIPLQHGLPGSVEVEVEETAPATLLLRTAGKLLDSPTRSSMIDQPGGGQR